MSSATTGRPGAWGMESIGNLLAMLQQTVRTNAQRTALIDPLPTQGYLSYTYEELWQSIRRVAGRLAHHGIVRDQRVGLLAESRAWWPVADFAIMSLGACTVPVYPSLPPIQIEHIVVHSGMSGLFLQDERQLAKLLSLDGGIPANLRFIVLLADVSSPALLADATRQIPVYQLSDWFADPDLLSLDEWTERWQAITAQDLATIVYTSGTTGQPKGAMLTHGNLLANVDGIRAYVSLFPTDRSLSYLPLSHIFERTAGQMVPLSVGGSIAYSRGFDKIVSDFQATVPTVLTTVPRLLEKIHEQVMKSVQASPAWRRRLFAAAVQYGMRARVHHQPVHAWLLRLYDRLVFAKLQALTGGQLRMMVVGGAPMPPYAAEFFTAAGFTVVEGYGMTETSPVISVNLPEAPRIGCAGKVLPNVEAQIAPDGELLVRGPSVMRGYLDDPTATEATFSPGGWLHTGDIGVLSADGYLHITDRKKNILVLSTGKKVTPAPIEAAILTSPFVDQVLLLGQGYKYVSALVVANETAIQPWLIERGLLADGASHGHSSTPVNALLLAEVRKQTQSFAGFEQPKKVLVATEPFTVENGELTPTLKVKSKEVLKHYQTAIDALYDDSADAAGQNQ